tara:strand:+ start:12362 stop:12823 length:462 start_codon:yes stop_codon:yes gene_type:complete
MNKQIVNLIEERLEKGKREYNEQLDVHDGRDWTKESLEEALDLTIYLTAEILKRSTIEKTLKNTELPLYRYFGCARLEDQENGLVSLDSKYAMLWDDIQTEMAYKINVNAFGGAYHDWMPVYIDQVVGVSSKFNKIVKIFHDGFVDPEDIIPE